MNHLSKVVVLLVAGVASVAADFDDIRFTTYNFDSFADIGATVVCHANLLDTAITGCTELEAAVDTEFTTEDWRNVCSEKLNFWNRDPANAQANAVVRTPNGGQTSFGCQIISCDGSNPANYNVEEVANGRETAVVMPNYYCGRPPVGMTVTTDPSADISLDLSSNPTGNIADIERGVLSLFATPNFNAVTPNTLCAIELDKSGFCWGGQDVSALTLQNVSKYSGTRLAIAVLYEDGTVEAAGNAATGGDISAAGNNAINGAASGNTRDIVCNVNGECVGILNDGTAYNWGAIDGSVASITNIDTAYPSFRGFLFCKTDGTCQAVGNPTYGGSPDAQDLTVLAKNIVAVGNNWWGFGIVADDGTAAAWGHPTFGTCSADVEANLTNIADVVTTFRGIAFRSNDNKVYSCGTPDTEDIGVIEDVAEIIGGKLENRLAVRKTDGTVEVYETTGLVGSINDGETYTSCKTSKNAVICLNSNGGVAKAFGIAAYDVPVDAQTGVAEVLEGATFSIGVRKLDGSVIIWGENLPTALAARQLASGDVQAASITPAYHGYAFVRGLAVPETSFPTLSPTTSPTGAPSATPSASPSKAPTGTPTGSPSKQPTESPSPQPTKSPLVPGTTHSPSTSPTTSPTKNPTTSPTANPTGSPTTPEPTRSPVSGPTNFPTAGPTPSPTLVCGCPSGSPPTSSRRR